MMSEPHEFHAACPACEARKDALFADLRDTLEAAMAAFGESTVYLRVVREVFPTLPRAMPDRPARREHDV
jgi:hypothetical protein